MSVYIKGMEMQENCYRCMFFRNTTEWGKDDRADILFRCVRTGEETWDYKGGYLPSCPLIPVPDHGPLIDKDALEQDISDSVVFSGRENNPEIYGANKIINRIRHSPTVIPASKEDGE